MSAATMKRPKPKTAKPHAMAFVADEPCKVCGCEWFRPTISFVPGAEEAIEGSGCANPWCIAIGQLKNRISELKTERLLLAKLASTKPEFDNPLAAMAAQKLRDSVLGGGNV